MKTVGLYVKEKKLKIFIFKRFDSVCKHIATILVLKISIKRKTTLKNFSAYKKKKLTPNVHIFKVPAGVQDILVVFPGHSFLGKHPSQLVSYMKFLCSIFG